MKKYSIGKGQSNDIILRCQNCLSLHAEIIYDKGVWVLNNLSRQNDIYVGSRLLRDDITLLKDDIIKIGRQKIYWNDYLYEGEVQEIRVKDLFSFHGRVSRANFRALSVLALGSAICVFFLPALLDLFAPSWIIRQLYISVDSIEYTIPMVYLICYPLIVISIIMLAIKRIRDTGYPIWKLLIPGSNLKLLYLVYSNE